jgi:hypothetical protein
MNSLQVMDMTGIDFPGAGSFPEPIAKRDHGQNRPLPSDEGTPMQRTITPGSTHRHSIAKRLSAHLAAVCTALVALSGISLSGDAGAVDPAVLRWAQGSIEYRRGGAAGVWGSEQWQMTVHADGTRTLQTRNEIPGLGIQRRAILRVEANFRPLELMAMVFTGGEWRGTGLFTVSGNTLQATVKSPSGLLTQTTSVPDGFSFIPHPIATDAWAAWEYDRTRPGPQQRTVYDLDSAATGAGSMLGRLSQQTLDYLGTEPISTAAGAFDCDHYQVTEGETVVDLYLTGPDAILVKFVYSGALGVSEFVLTHLETGENQHPQEAGIR